MTTPELLALSLAVSFAAGALGLVVMRTLEHRVADPILRERAWGAVLYLSALPPLAVGLMLMVPAPIQTAIPTFAAAASAGVVELSPASGLEIARLARTAAVAVLLLAGLLAALRAMSLGLRLMRLRRRIAATVAAAPDLQRTVEQMARDLGAAVPAVRVSKAEGEALLAGLRQPILVLPAALAETPGDATTRAVCAHELAHLKRGDHRALWVEEGLLVIAAINPLLPVIRDHRAAAREEACDALALAGADDGQRRLYARSLLDAVRSAGFRTTAPALTFTPARRTFVMNRLKAVLVPASPAGSSSRRVTAGLAALIAGVVGAGSFAVAAQRQPVLVPEPVEAAIAPATVVGAVPSSPTATVAADEQPAPAPAVDAAPRARPLREEPPVATPAPALGATQEASPAPVITYVTWAQQPLPNYPAEAARNGVESGAVVLSCNTDADGNPSGCSILSETPAGVGFGAAALTAMQAARFSPRMIDGAAPDAKVRFTIRFRLGE